VASHEGCEKGGSCAPEAPTAQFMREAGEARIEPFKGVICMEYEVSH